MLLKPLAILIAAGALALGTQTKAAFITDTFADADNYNPGGALAGGKLVASGGTFTGNFDIVPAVSDGTASFTVSTIYKPSTDVGNTYSSTLGFNPKKEVVTDGVAKFWLHNTAGNAFLIDLQIDELSGKTGGKFVILAESVGVSVIAKLNIDGRIDYVVKNNGAKSISLDYAYLGVEVVPVPESSTYVAGALLLLPFGASALRSIRGSRLT